MVSTLKPNWNMINQIKMQRCSQGNIYQKLHLNDIGLDINNFNLLRLSFNNLPIDNDYPEKKKMVTRFRRYSNFDVNIIDRDRLEFKQNNSNLFKQDVEDFRSKTRLFTNMEDNIINETFYNLMSQIVGLTLFSNPKILKMNIDVHQVRLLSGLNLVSDNAPEGIHRDGADYIVSALILNKYNIMEGKSVIYDVDKNVLDQHELELGEFLFQEDKHLWHDITPIRSKENYYGYRDILGFDLKIIE